MNADTWANCERLLLAAFGDASTAAEFSEDSLCTAGQLLSRQGAAAPSGLGDAADHLLHGGFRAGEVVEVFGPAGVGKTQLALSVAAHAASSGSRVIYATAKDSPFDLACRLKEILAARGVAQGSEAQAALRNVRLASMGDFADLARILAEVEALPDSLGPGRPPLLILDLATLVLAPFTAAVGSGHRWRFAWLWRQLRQLSNELSVHILLLSHTVGGVGANSGRSQLALGPMWASASTMRLELVLLGAHGGPGAAGAAGDKTGRPYAAAQHLALILRKGRRRSAEGSTATVVLCAAGVCAAPEAAAGALADRALCVA